MTTTRYDARWPHVTVYREPTEDDTFRFPRFVKRDYAFSGEWDVTCRELRYNADDRLAAWFIYQVNREE